MKRLAGVDEKLQKLLECKMDDVAARRRVREAFKEIQFSIDHILFKTPCDGLEMKESYEANSRGLEIFWKSWLPGKSKPKAAVFLCHGYGDTCTFFFEGVARKLVSAGYGVFAMDYPGFGLSEGLHGYISNFDRIVDDVIDQYSKIKENPDVKSLPKFLLGESMGGAIALKMHLKQPNAWDGAILCAPMCKISEDMLPPKVIAKMLIGMSNVLPKHKLVPTKDISEAAFRDLKKREQTAYNVISYKDKTRLRTAMELLKTTQVIEQKMEYVSLPLLILHGEADTVTDPSVSKALFDKASSVDKKFMLYKDAYHCLLAGESDDAILKIFDDIITWLDEHSLKQTQSSS